MATAAESLAREVSELRRRLSALERSRQLSRSTITDADGAQVPLVDAVRTGITAGAQAADAIEAAASALAKADGAVESFFGADEPEGGKVGDLWRKPNGEVLQHDGEGWAEVTDPQVRADLDAALDRLAETEGALDGKVSTFFAPLLQPPHAAAVGDLWFVSDKGNLLRRWNGAEWVDARDAAIEDAVSTAAQAKQEAQNAIDAAAQAALDLVEARNKATDAARRAAEAAAAAEAAEGSAGLASGDVLAAQNAADEAAASAIEALARAQASGANATAAQTAADAAKSAATTAEAQAKLAGTGAAKADAAAAQAAADAAQAVADAAKAAEKSAAAQTAADKAANAAQSSAVSATAAQSSADVASRVAESATTTAANAVQTAEEAASAAASAQSEAASAAGIAGGKADVLIQATAPAAEFRKSTTLWIDTTGGANTPKRWTSGTTWTAVTDKKAADAATAAGNAATAASNAQAAADAAKADAATAAAAAKAAKDRADTAHTLAGTAESNAQSALSSAAGAASAATAAQSSADAAKSDAAAAAGLAEGKADVLIQAATPTTDFRKSTTLWIDTTSSTNTPKRWSGSAWVAVTDKKATDAATAAATAQKAAEAAQKAADTVSKNLFSTAAPSGTAPYGSTWFRVNSSGQVIGQWQQTAAGEGSTWTVREIRSEVIANLDVGKLTAGSVTTPSAVVDKLYSDVVESRELKGQYIEADSITARHMRLVGQNLIPDPYFLNAALNAERLSLTTVPAGSLTFLADDTSTGNVARFTAHDDTYRSFFVSGNPTDGRVPAKKGDVFKFRVLYRTRGNAVAGAATSGIRFAIHQDSPAKAYIRYVGVGSYKTITTSGANWYEFEGEYKITQDDVGYIRPTIQFRNPAWSGELEFKQPSILNAATAGTLESDLVLTSRVIAGDANGTRAEMSPEGFRVYAADQADGTAKEVVRMGVASTDDYFAVTRSDGTLAATISQDGNIASNSVSVDKDLYYRGDTLEAILDRLPRGIVAQAYRTTPSPTYGSSTTSPYLHITFPVENGRMYKISTNNWKVSGTGSALGSMWWSETGRATTSSNWLDFCYTAPSSMGASWQSPIHFNRTFRSWWTGTLSILVAVRSIGSSTIAIGGDGGANANVLLIEDLGIMPTDTGEWQDGTQATPPPIKRTYDKTWTASATRSYLPGGGVYNFNTTKMFQGLSPAGYGNLSSAAVFPDMTATLSGATINSVQVYVYFDHWYYNNGGTARFGLIGKTLPGTMTASTGIVATSGGWPKPGGRWVNIPSAYWNGFKTGQWGGLSLNGDGTYGTYGYANNQPKIKINYTK